MDADSSSEEYNLFGVPCQPMTQKRLWTLDDLEVHIKRFNALVPPTPEHPCVLSSSSEDEDAPPSTKKQRRLENPRPPAVPFLRRSLDPVSFLRTWCEYQRPRLSPPLKGVGHEFQLFKLRPTKLRTKFYRTPVVRCEWVGAVFHTREIY
jgi:hypothetical protein